MLLRVIFSVEVALNHLMTDMNLLQLHSTKLVIESFKFMKEKLKLSSTLRKL